MSGEKATKRKKRINEENDSSEILRFQLSEVIKKKRKIQEKWEKKGKFRICKKGEMFRISEKREKFRICKKREELSESPEFSTNELD